MRPGNWPTRRSRTPWTGGGRSGDRRPQAIRCQSREGAMNTGGKASLWPDALIREAGEHFQFLVKDHGFRQVDHIDRWQVNVEFRGERLTLSLTHGDREADFYAEIKYAKFPRKNPRALWSVL